MGHNRKNQKTNTEQQNSEINFRNAEQQNVKVDFRILLKQKTKEQSMHIWSNLKLQNLPTCLSKQLIMCSNVP